MIRTDLEMVRGKIKYYGCVLWRHLVSACEVKAHLIGCWQHLGAVCVWQPRAKPGCGCPAWKRRHSYM